MDVGCRVPSSRTGQRTDSTNLTGMTADFQGLYTLKGVSFILLSFVFSFRTQSCVFCPVRKKVTFDLITSLEVSTVMFLILELEENMQLSSSENQPG